MTKKCFYCSYPNRDDATTCISCGLELNKYWIVSNGRTQLIDEYGEEDDE